MWGFSSSWWWRQSTLLKRRSTCTRLHGATSQKAVIFVRIRSFIGMSRWTPISLDLSVLGSNFTCQVQLTQTEAAHRSQPVCVSVLFSWRTRSHAFCVRRLLFVAAADYDRPCLARGRCRLQDHHNTCSSLPAKIDDHQHFYNRCSFSLRINGSWNYSLHVSHEVACEKLTDGVKSMNSGLVSLHTLQFIAAMHK
jgi:hypothetical protein